MYNNKNMVWIYDFQWTGSLNEFIFHHQLKPKPWQSNVSLQKSTEIAILHRIKWRIYIFKVLKQDYVTCEKIIIIKSYIYL